MSIINILKTPLYAAQVASSAKSFKKNPIIGNRQLNEWGLHKKRLLQAHKMAEKRRKALADPLESWELREFRRNGFLLYENYLHDETFLMLREELKANPLQAWEMKQGQTVTRMAPLGSAARALCPTTAEVTDNIYLQDRIRFAAGIGGQPLYFIQTVLTNPSVKKADPQTKVHADTFHSTSKAWLFLEDVALDEGPFSYAPGSHQLNKLRIEWEYEQSLAASGDTNNHHAHGSFRASDDDLRAMGYNLPRPFPVKANTLVIADTFGFHGRTPSEKPTTRIELHAHMRRNPFLPWNSFDVKSVPGIRHNELEIYLGWTRMRERVFGTRSIWHDVGTLPYKEPSPLMKQVKKKQPISA
ncbi:phytanoyl-CoA dioxygenase [Rhodobacteraceae bacterium RKSG542]|uniref:phytanoyl-CoA dioxygenase family protein n=1 Tax=Pseudovibrio flavus TaxID=2529854 RepID=UPI0012BB4D49|nr:phytanoyl-CoA dioxygenase family protein [Pseudovibrio flavus]MTI19175.1 phytanoyl-CoA dioxygenase [Pseudovibrio flavus]